MIETQGRLARLSAGTAIAIASLCTTPFAFAQANKVSAVITEQTKVEEAAQASQARIAQLDDETSRLLQNYRSAISEAESLKVYNESMTAQVQSQQAEIESIKTQLTQIESTARGVLPMMQRMLVTLEQFVALDLPFLPEERSKRITDLKLMMDSANVTLSEKYRRIVEAYQIEMEYGRTINHYECAINGRNVTCLRLGRLALMYQTLDGAETGYWDASQKVWVVDNGYHDAVARGIDIAAKRTAPDMIIAPVRVTDGK